MDIFEQMAADEARHSADREQAESIERELLAQEEQLPTTRTRTVHAKLAPMQIMSNDTVDCVELENGTEVVCTYAPSFIKQTPLERQIARRIANRKHKQKRKVRKAQCTLTNN